MKAVTVMFDSLNKHYLPPYGNQEVIAPNFSRLAKRCVTFDNFYCGSMPCMPARRELHTGRYNFLHRAWGPLEPFDDSAPEILSNNGICTQFISDHLHYWQDGGLTYHTRYSAFEMVRGQEGDEWHGRASQFSKQPGKRKPRLQDVINREYTRDDQCCHARCFESAKDFLLHNHDQDSWYLHLEYFDPHEPFDAPEKYKKLYTDDPADFDWPYYEQVGNPEQLRQAIINYKASVSLCDDYLGKLLDLFDAYDLWKDTLLIVNTDHGFLLGEHGFIAKNYMPCFNELTNLPFFMYDPRHPGQAGQRRSALTQTIDIAPTLLSYFGCELPGSMTGKILEDVIVSNKKIHEAVLYGYFGKHINITDGRYTYFRAARDNSQLYEYTLMPTRLASFFTKDELKMADTVLCRDFGFCQHVPMLRIPAHSKDVPPKASHLQYDEHMKYGDLFFDLEMDPHQSNPITPSHTILDYLERMMTSLMEEHEAPEEQYVRMNLERCHETCKDTL